MAKISPVAAKYIVHANIVIEGVVDRPDVIGAIFGQTEGLLGNDLELRELQRSGKIGRIEVNVNTSSGKTSGEIVIPSSLDKTETAIVAAALEIIQRIGPCNAKVEIKLIEDIRVSKRLFVIERAKALLRELTEKTLPDSQELADEVAQSVMMMEVVEYGRERLAAGPAVDESEELIVVEGRADVLNLLKHGFKNIIALNGTTIPQTVRELSKKKTITLFVDGDRGGDLIIRGLLSTAEIDFVCKAPDGKEVEEITKKEIHKALRGRITSEQAKLELGIDDQGMLKEDPEARRQVHSGQRRYQEHRSEPNGQSNFQRPLRQQLSQRDSHLSPEEKKIFKEILENLFGTRGACIFDQKLNVLGKVPLSELSSTIKSLNGGIYALALDGAIDMELVRTAERLGISHIIGTSSRVQEAVRINVMTEENL